MNENMDNGYEMNQDSVNRYRQQRVEQFRLNINENPTPQPEPEVKQDFSDEISSFSDENTRAQIERESKKELRRQKKEERKVERIKASRNKKVYRLAWIVLVAMITVVITQFLIRGVNDFLAINRKDSTLVTIKIQADDTPADIAKQLEDKGVIDSRSFFTVFAKVTGKVDDVMPGIYRLPKNKDYLGILNYLQFTGNVQSTIEVVITEGTNIRDLVDKLYVEGVTSKEDKEEFLTLCNSDIFDEDYPFLKKIEADPDREYKLEGYLFPDTYQFYVDEAPEVTIRRFLDNFYARFFEYEYEVEGYQEPVTINDLMQDNNLGYTLDEFVNMASIIQAEAANDSDMFNVSSVIHNRLEFGPQHDIHTLGMDSTMFYPYKNKNAVPSDIRDTFESAYDTYKYEGLPPSAICSPSANALMAAVMPNDTDYLYFCHAEGKSYYAATFYEHQSNLSKAGLN